MKRKWDLASDEVQRHCIEAVLARLDEIGDSRPGTIAAQEIIDIVTENLAPSIYNAGIEDTVTLLETTYADLQTDIGVLKQ